MTKVKVIGRASRVEAKPETTTNAKANMKKGGKKMEELVIDVKKMSEADKCLAASKKNPSVFYGGNGCWWLHYYELPNAKRLESIHEERLAGKLGRWAKLSEDEKVVMSILGEGQALREMELGLQDDWAAAVKKLCKDVACNPRDYRDILQSKYHSEEIEDDAYEGPWLAYFDVMPMTVNCRVSEGIQYAFTTGVLPAKPWTDAERECIKVAVKYLKVIRTGWLAIQAKMACLVKGMGNA